ncbi:MAG: hypothetical protein ABIR96_11705 [Bdellovibrionota bacterium]
MARHGRQQLLKRASSRSGQAIIELLPSVIIFFTVIVAALNYFRVMRAAVIREEVVRNSVFALINNSGTLTTPPNLLADAGSSSEQVADAGIIETGVPNAVKIMSKSKYKFVGGASTCFVVYPSDAIAKVGTPLFSMFSSGSPSSVDFLTYAVINRQPGGNCAY